MVKKSRSRNPKRKRDAVNRRNRRRGVSRRGTFPSLPPRLPMNTVNYPRHTIRVSTSLSLPINTLTGDYFDLPSLLVNTRYSDFDQIFKEYKIHWVKVWYISGVAPTTKGTYTMVVGDPDEIQSTLYDTEADLASFPGSMTRRVNENLYGMWFPTEPNQRNWNLCGSNHKILGVIQTSTGVLFASEKINKLTVCCVTEINISFRGVVNRKSLSIDKVPSVPYNSPNTDDNSQAFKVNTSASRQVSDNRSAATILRRDNYCILRDCNV